MEAGNAMRWDNANDPPDAARNRSRIFGAALVLSLIGAAAQAAEEDATAILKRMSDYLAAQQTVSLTFDSDIEVITPQMEKIQFASSGEAVLSRPDKLRARRIGGYTDVELVYDGTTASIHDLDGNRYIRFEAPGTIDDLVTALRQGHGVALPAADLLLSNPYETLLADVIEAKHIGQGVIEGRACEHLAFRNLETDWQIWIEAGDRPMPCKLVITSKAVGGAPQYTVRIKDWQTGLVPTADAFAFVPPPGAEAMQPDALIHLDELPPPATEGEGR